MQNYDELLHEYYDPSHGLELQVDEEPSKRQNENGILYLVETMFLLDMLRQSTATIRSWFMHLSYALRSYKDQEHQIHGLYDRGARESLDVPASERRTISHDNISAISAGSYWANSIVASQIYKYGIQHLFVYNNCKPRTRGPMNPGNYAIWSYMGGSRLLWVLFIPFYLINFFLSMSKDREHTTARWLYFVELYPVRKSNPFWKWLWKLYVDDMQSMYGTKFLHEIAKIYFRDPNHPVTLFASKIEFYPEKYHWKVHD